MKNSVIIWPSILLFGSMIVVSCLGIKDFAYQKKKHKIDEFNQTKIKEIDQVVSSSSDTILKLYCYDELCNSYCNNIIWIYKEKDTIRLKAIEHGRSSFKMSESQNHVMPDAIELFDFIEKNRLDTVKSTINTYDYSCDDCGWIDILYKINKDTIINRRCSYAELYRGDTNHLFNKYAKLVINQLNEIEKKYH